MTDTGGVRGRVYYGVAFMASRLAASYVLRLASVLILARLLVPADYAVFAAAATLVGVAQFATDLGLGGALVQRREAPDDLLLGTVFWTKLGLSLGVVAVVWAVAPAVSAFAHYGDQAPWMVRVFVLQLPIDVLRTVPAATLDRRLSFERSTIAELTDLVATYTAQLGLAALGMHAWALVLAGPVRAVAGSIAYYVVSPWKVPLTWDWQRLRSLLGFSAPYHGANVLQAVRAMIPAWVVGRYAMAHDTGLLVWSLAIAGIGWPIATLVDRVMFPAFARAAESVVGRREAANTLLLAGAGGAALLVCVLAPAPGDLIAAVFGTRWAGAASMLRATSVITACAIMAYLNASIFNGLGRPHWRLAISAVAGAAELTLALLFVPRFGAWGFLVVAMGVAGAEALASIGAASRAIGSVLWRPVALLVVGGAAAALVTWARASEFAVVNHPVAAVGLSVGLGVLAVWGLARTEFRLVWSGIRQTLGSR